MNLRHGNPWWLDVLIAIAIPYILVSINGAVMFGSLMPFANGLLVLLLLPVGCIMLFFQLSPYALVVLVCLAIAVAALRFSMPSLLRIPLLIACLAGLFFAAAQSGILNA